jgi:DNA-binding beta-propeller fold protein YncE
VNLQDVNIFAVIDPATDEVIGRYPVGRCKGNHGMTLDPEHHRAFLSCEENNLMTVFDLDKHEPIVYLDMAGGPDVIKFDPGLSRIYPLVTAEPFLSFTKMTQSTIESLKTLRFNTLYTASQWTPKLTVSIRQSRRRTESSWPVWSSMKL